MPLFGNRFVSELGIHYGAWEVAHPDLLNGGDRARNIWLGHAGDMDGHYLRPVKKNGRDDLPGG